MFKPPAELVLRKIIQDKIPTTNIPIFHKNDVWQQDHKKKMIGKNYYHWKNREKSHGIDDDNEDLTTNYIESRRTKVTLTIYAEVKVNSLIIEQDTKVSSTQAKHYNGPQCWQLQSLCSSFNTESTSEYEIEVATNNGNNALKNDQTTINNTTNGNNEIHDLNEPSNYEGDDIDTVFHQTS